MTTKAEQEQTRHDEHVSALGDVADALNVIADTMNDIRKELSTIAERMPRK